MIRKILLCAGLVPALLAAADVQEKIVLLNEGNWQADNGRLTYFEDGRIVSNQWFRDVNGTKLGDTPNDIIYIDNQLIAIAVNWSNVIQFIDSKGKAVAAVEDIPNNRCLASDADYVYVSSYGHECTTVNGVKTFTKGFVAKIDLNTFEVVGTCEVGYEPEGIALYDGYLFVANTGGYAAQEDHDYEQTVSVINTSDMSVFRTVDTGQINMYGHVSCSGQYLCIPSPGDYYEVSTATIIMDCERVLAGQPDGDCFVKLDCAATKNCVNADGNFYAIGSKFNYYTGDYTFDYLTIDPEAVMTSHGASGVSGQLPGTVLADLKAMTSPYNIYVNPYTGYIYATDAGSYVANGTLVQWSPDGTKLSSGHTYISPSYMVALPPDGYTAIDRIVTDTKAENSIMYNLQGMPVSNPQPGQIVICNGRKILVRCL